MTTRKSSKRPATRRSRTPSRRERRDPVRTAWLVLVVAAAAGACLYPPWDNVWTNFEGFRMHAPLVYAFLWSPPPPVFPVARAIDIKRLAWELVAVVVAGGLVYWALGKRHGRR